MRPTSDSASCLEQEIFTRISKNEASELKTLLGTNNININFVDENGMNPLQHACYKGNMEIVQMLLDQGADVNTCDHQHAYTALHFAALSGNAELCHLLMTHGAKIDATNSVGRTAAQMAAFVGNHACVATINSFIPKADIDYYIQPQGLQAQPMLPPHLADPLHKFLVQVNIHPIKVAMTLQKCPGLLDNLEKVQRVLESMRHREMTRRDSTNEIMAFKYHYLSCIVAELLTLQKRAEARRAEEKTSEEEKSKTDPVEVFIRAQLKCVRSDGPPEYQERLLRDVVREFPYRESTIFRQIVATLGRADPPSALSVVTAAINGQRGFYDSAVCVTCGDEKASKKCSKCRAVQYCDRECQRRHWFIHKKECARESASAPKVSEADKPDIADAVKSELSSLSIN